MPRPSEEISKYNANSSGKPDSNLANDALHLGGIPANEYATEKYVQVYHGAKEELLKEYIDSQDLAKLQEAKDYVDTMIRNQDFSSFAKLTDLQALSQNLSARIEAYKTQCQNELNTRINAVVNDVNSNFNDVNGAISTLNSRTNQLFTSVSNGKDLIAGAITDKGIHTSANDSFNTMATNIRNIETSGSGDYDENFVNTSDGNATANDISLGKIAYAKGQRIYGTHIDTDTSDATATNNDILLGKTAYVDGEKIIGTHIDIDTSDANATEDDILLGKTAYVNGQKITGRSTVNPSAYPTYGTDTSGATATSADILYGKTAYARGQLLTGTLRNTEVEEIYAIETVDEINTDIFNTFKTDPITGDTITERKAISYSKDGLYSVSVTKLNNESTQYIESYAVNENGFYIQQSSGATTNTVTTKKYRYSKSDLDIDDDEVILSTAISPGGLNGNSENAVLLIVTRGQDTATDGSYYHYYLYIFSYHLTSNGVIGRAYENENAINIKKELLEKTWNNYGIKAICLNNTNTTFYVVAAKPHISYGDYSPYNLVKVDMMSNGVVTTLYTKATNSSIGGYIDFTSSEVFISNDDRYIILGGEKYSNTTGSSSNSGGVVPFIYNEIESGVYTPILGSTKTFGTHQNILIDSTMEIFLMPNDSSTQLILSYFTLTEQNVATLTEIKSIEIVYPQILSSYSKYLSLIGIVGDKLLVEIQYFQYNQNRVVNPDIVIGIIDISDIENAEQLTIEELIYTPIGRKTTLFHMRPYTNSDGSVYILHNIQDGTNEAFSIKFDINSNKLIGVKYRDKYFYNYTPQQLTAGQPDVRAGKTFIGWMGHPETGTMEVE